MTKISRMIQEELDKPNVHQMIRQSILERSGGDAVNDPPSEEDDGEEYDDGEELTFADEHEFAKWLAEEFTKSINDYFDSRINGVVEGVVDNGAIDAIADALNELSGGHSLEYAIENWIENHVDFGSAFAKEDKS